MDSATLMTKVVDILIIETPYDGKIKFHSGVFDLSCATTKSPYAIKEDLLKCFSQLRIAYHNDEVTKLLK